MYSLDVNFLKDRKLNEPAKASATTKIPTKIDVQKNQPIFIGLGAGAAILLITGLVGLWANAQQAETQAKIGQLDSELQQLQGQTKSIEEMRAKVKTLEAENQALVTVFQRIKPWSAILQEIRAQTPPNVQVNDIQQVDTAGIQSLTITGFATNFDAVNNYLLTLQSSPLLNKQATAIQKANIAPYPGQIINDNKNITVAFPDVVNYTIVTALADTPASEQLPVLARNGAIGVVTRIQQLERQGALKP